MKQKSTVPALLLCAALVLGGCAPKGEDPVLSPTPEAAASQEPAGVFAAGAYTATAQGKGGDLTVEAVFTDTEIQSVTVLANQETKGLADAALTDIPSAIVAAQSVGVDAVSGVTLTSAAILEAVADCITQAGADPDAFRTAAGGTQTGTPQAEDTATQVLVVGAGPAGLTAAIAAAGAGSDVLVIEKTDRFGGAGIYAHTNFPVPTSRSQNAAGAENSYEEFYQIGVSESRADPEMVALLLQNSGAAADWLMDNGADLGTVVKNYNLKPSNGNAPGYEVLTALKRIFDDTDVELRYNSEATELLVEDGKVCGARVSGPGGTYEIRAEAVVLATGGFSANQEMLAEYTPYWGGCTTDNPASSTGDGIRMAKAMGAQLTHMDHVRTSLSPDTPVFMAARSGAVLVNREGKRFVNELDDLSLAGVAEEQLADVKKAHDLWMSLPVTTLAEQIVQQTGGMAYLVMDRSVVDASPAVQGTLGLYETADSLEALAEALDVDRDAFLATIEQYRGYTAGGVDPDFGKSAVTCAFETGPYYYAAVAPLVHSTFGGIAVDGDMRALDTDGAVIPGLYAAGETADDGTYSLTPLPRAVVFGGLAGRRAAEEVAK